MTVEFKGFDEFDKMLQQLPLNVEKRVVQAATVSALRAAVKNMRNAAPKHTGKQSPSSKKYGTGQKNISVRPKKKKKGVRGALLSTRDAFWLYFYEKGTRYQPARPFWNSAFKLATPVILSKLNEYVNTRLQKEFDKLK